MKQELDITPTNPVIGRSIQDYRIVSLLQKGGMGDIYLAKHPLIGKQIAIKLLKTKYASDRESLVRFFREAQTVNEIHHENVIDIFNLAYLPESEEAFILMEYLEGEMLSLAIKKDSPFSTRRVGHIGLQVCSALSAAHKKGIVHRDVKPDNLFLIERAGQRDFVKVLDFGLVKLREGYNAIAVSQQGFTVGTPAYMAPEQAVGEIVDERADIYAFGVVLYEMATGFLPFTAKSAVDVMRKQVTAPLPLPSTHFPEIESALEKIIVCCLQKDKRTRYSSMQEVSEALAKACSLDLAPYMGQKLASIRFGVPSTKSFQEQISQQKLSIETLPSSLTPAQKSLDNDFDTSSDTTKPFQQFDTLPENTPAQEKIAFDDDTLDDNILFQEKPVSSSLLQTTELPEENVVDQNTPAPLILNDDSSPAAIVIDLASTEKRPRIKKYQTVRQMLFLLGILVFIAAGSFFLRSSFQNTQSFTQKQENILSSHSQSPVKPEAKLSSSQPVFLQDTSPVSPKTLPQNPEKSPASSNVIPSSNPEEKPKVDKKVKPPKKRSKNVRKKRASSPKKRIQGRSSSKRVNSEHDKLPPL